MRIDHIAYRVADRSAAINFFENALGYEISPAHPDGFEIKFANGSTAKCMVLIPPSVRVPNMGQFNEDFTKLNNTPWTQTLHLFNTHSEFHLPPEIFVSEGTPGSIVGEWVKARSGVGGIHHIAYQVESVSEKMEEWRTQGLATFTTAEPLMCPGLTQAFTNPHPVTGLIYELIERDEDGFCKENVKDLMESTHGH